MSVWCSSALGLWRDHAAPGDRRRPADRGRHAPPRQCGGHHRPVTGTQHRHDRPTGQPPAAPGRVRWPRLRAAPTSGPSERIAAHSRVFVLDDLLARRPRTPSGVSATRWRWPARWWPRLGPADRRAARPDRSGATRSAAAPGPVPTPRERPAPCRAEGVVRRQGHPAPAHPRRPSPHGRHRPPRGRRRPAGPAGRNPAAVHLFDPVTATAVIHGV